MLAQLATAGAAMAASLLMQHRVLAAIMKVLVDKNVVTTAELDAALLATPPAEPVNPV